MNSKQNTTLLSDTEEHFRFIANLIPDIIWTALPNGHRDFYNNKFTEYTGLDTEEAKGQGWEKMIHSDDLYPTITKWEECLQNGNLYENEYRFKRYDGTYRWFLIRAAPWKDEAGNIVKWFGTTTDIHSRKLANRKLMETTNDLTNANQELSRINDVLNHFVYIAAHDLRSPMNNMRMLFDLLKEEKDQAKKDELFLLIEKSVLRLDRTVRGLMEIIQNATEDGGSQTLQFEDILQIVLSDLSTTYPDISEYVISDFKNHPAVKYTKPYLISIIKNLVSNAYKYQSQKRKLQINIFTEKTNGWIKLVVRDNGKGFDLNSSKDIFGPFKRLTTEGEGTGVGLYVVKNIVEKNGGKVEAYSQVEKGATFSIFLKEYNSTESSQSI